ncbi:hypothetical protein C8R44DRAFT_882494 [Mycena epipterygia]|nr:hypothetical protein C8R44DRAFT_882494 [Mycena epipterygia]
MNGGGNAFDPQQLYDDVSYMELPATARDEGVLGASLPATGQYSDKFSASDTEDDGKSSTAIGSIQHSWSPKLLHIVPICLFAALLLLLIIGLELFYRHSPYNAPSVGAQFMWTYAPVALLMIVQWIWTAYDLQVKILIPWAAMSCGPTPAQQGWLLDYIGNNVLVGVWTAFKYRHTVVLLTTLGLWSTALAGIVTTSLFKIQDNPHTSAANFNLSTTLDRSLLTAFDPAILADKNYLNSYLGRQVLNLSRPQWTTADNIVIEAFEYSSGLAADTLTAQTQGYSAGLECTKAVASYGGNVSIVSNVVGFPHAYAFFVDVDAAGCQVKYKLTDSNVFISCSGDPCYFGRVYNHTCPGSSVYTTALVLASMSNFTFVSASAAECSPTYSQYLLDVSVPPSAPVEASVASHTADSAMIDGWRGMLQWINSTNGVQRGHTVSTSLEGDLFGAWGNTAMESTNCDCDPWFFLIGHGQNVSAPDLMNPSTLMNASAETFPGVFSDVAQALLVKTAPTSAAPLSGTVKNVTRQLVARETSVRIAQAALSVLLAAVVGVYLLRPQTILPMDPSSIAVQAFLLKSDHDDISAIIKDTVTATNAETSVLLEDWSFSIANDEEFRIKTERSGTVPPIAPKFIKAPVWRPFVLHPIFKVSLCLIVIGTIIGLEIGLRKSESNRGFADFIPSNQDSWTYAAPAYLFVLGIFLSSYTFSVRTLEPFFAMHRSPQPARKSVRYSPATQTNAGLVLHAVRYRSLVGLSCALIMLTVPFLKIVVSGLITTATEPAQELVQLAAASTFNTTSILPPVEFPTNAYMQLPGEIFALSQIEKYQLPLPAWTTPVGAIAHLDTVRLGQIVHSPNTTINLPLQVMRADLVNCRQLTGSDLVVPPNVLQLPLPTAPNGTLLCSSNAIQPVLLTFPTSPGWFGELYPLQCGGYALIYGSTQANNASQIKDLTVVQCTSYTLAMATQNMTLAYEQDTVKILSIDSSTPINTTTMDSFPANESGHLATNLPPATFETNSSLSFDTFFQIMTLKNTSTPLETFLDPSALTAAAQALYTAYWAIHASLYEQIPLADAAQHPMAVVVNYQNTRIVQAETPTRILQALLACVLACGLLTAVSVRKTNNVLTKPPYSIGATMGLLADSAFVELEELHRVKNEAGLERVLEPYGFQLGWGNNPKGGMRFGVDIST